MSASVCHFMLSRTTYQGIGALTQGLDHPQGAKSFHNNLNYLYRKLTVGLATGQYGGGNF